MTDLGAEAVGAALEEAGVGRDGLQAAFCGTAYAGVASGHKVLGRLAMTGMPIIDVEAGCASGAAALMLAAASIRSGEHDTVLAFGIEKMPKGIIRSSFFEPWQEEAGLNSPPGLLRPAGPTADGHIGCHRRGPGRGSGEEPPPRSGQPRRHVPVRGHRRAGAGLADGVSAAATVDAVLAQRGAAAVVLRRADGVAPGVELVASVVVSHLPGAVLSESTPLSGLCDDTLTPPTTRPRQAASRAGVGPDKLDWWSARTPMPPASCSPTRSSASVPRRVAALLRDGATRLGGRLPVNVSGGLLSKGEPLGASALGQVVEVVRQLRSKPGPARSRGPGWAWPTPSAGGPTPAW